MRKLCTLTLLISIFIVQTAFTEEISEFEPNNTLETAQDIDNHFILGYNEDIADSTTIPWVSITATGDDTFDYYTFYSPGSTVISIFDIDYGFQPDDPGSFDSITALWDASGNCLKCDHGCIPSAGAGGSTHGEDSYLGYAITDPGWYVIGVAKDNYSIVCPNDKSQLNDGFNSLFTPIPSGATYELQVSIPGHDYKPIYTCSGFDPPPCQWGSHC